MIAALEKMEINAGIEDSLFSMPAAKSDKLQLSSSVIESSSWNAAD